MGPNPGHSHQRLDVPQPGPRGPATSRWAAAHNDVLFYHTQATALFSLRLARRVPVVVSLDATPINMDSVAARYGHRPDGPGPAGRLKRVLVSAAFSRAAALTTWNRWARESLVRDYRVDPGKIGVIPPGVDLDAWRPAPRGGGRRRGRAGRRGSCSSAATSRARGATCCSRPSARASPIAASSTS